MPSSHYLNHCRNIVVLTLRNKLQWNINGNSCIFIQENTFEYVAHEMAPILSQPQWVYGNMHNFILLEISGSKLALSGCKPQSTYYFECHTPVGQDCVMNWVMLHQRNYLFFFAAGKFVSRVVKKMKYGTSSVLSEKLLLAQVFHELVLTIWVLRLGWEDWGFGMGMGAF